MKRHLFSCDLHPPSRVFGTAIVSAVCLAAVGCASIGPPAIAGGRMMYTEVINQTEDEQLLNMIVRHRYDATISMLEVASVTANIKAAARVDAEIGVGPFKNYDGNLVPLAAGVAYEDNPTISYTPLDSADVIERLMSPIPLDQLLLLSREGRPSGRLFSVMIRNVNGVSNPAYVGERTRSGSFATLTSLWEALRTERVLVMGRQQDGFAVAFMPHDPLEAEQCAMLFSLIDLVDPPTAGERRIVSLVSASFSTDPNGIVLGVASVLDAIKVAGNGVEIPAAHLASGVARPPPPASADLQPLRIHASSERPNASATAIRYRDMWYYVADNDLDSKRAFAVLRLLVGMRLNEDSEQRQNVPLLTVPVR